MPQTETMTDEEKVDTAYQASMLRRAGDKEGFSRLIRTIPMPPYLAKVLKEKMGTDFLKNC